jgi:phosphoserine aminotransferase
METAFWNLLGARSVDVLECDVFSRIWADDIGRQLGLEARVFSAPFGHFPEISTIDSARDIVFCWTGTTACVSVPHTEWIEDDRLGLIFCDATAATFLIDLPWSKLDATAFSCQKVLGGEASFGFLVLSPRASSRLEHYIPAWPIPHLMRLKKDNEVLTDVFHERTVNTISLLVVEDLLNTLAWVEQIGGVQTLRQRTQTNYAYVEKWITRQEDFTYFVQDPAVRALTPIGLAPAHEGFEERSVDDQWKYLTRIVDILERERFAFDVLGHIKSAPHLRFWIGPTISPIDIARALDGLSWVWTKLGQEL